MRYLCIGEPLVEFTSQADAPSVFERRAGGDTLNSAIYLSRLSPAGSVGYLSQLGDDRMSLWLRSILADEGIVDLCATQTGGRPGLSFISTDARGERSFTYWRDRSPAREMFQDHAALTRLEGAETILLSGVTLAILYPQGREALLGALAARRRAGARIVLDTNYRPALWPDPAAAREAIGRAAGLATLLLPSLDDLSACFACGTAAQAMDLLAGMGDAETVLTTGGDAVHYRPAGGAARVIPLPTRIAATDTTGAGDSFNAAWLAARHDGLSPEQAIARAATLATEVVRHPGAVIPRTAMPNLERPELA
jgi:2-dehydro-3-deoxygluconokinase